MAPSIIRVINKYIIEMDRAGEYTQKEGDTMTGIVIISIPDDQQIFCE